MKKETLAKVKVIFKLLGFLAAVSAAELVSSVLVSPFGGKVAPQVFILLQSTLAFIFPFLVIYLFLKKIDKESFASMGLTVKGQKRNVFLGILWGAVCLAVGFACVVGIEPANVAIGLQPFSIAFQATYQLTVLVAFILVAFIEEMIFRGYLLRKLLGVFNNYTAICISAVVFSLVHMFAPGYDIFTFINIFIIGIFFALMYMYTNSLWFVIGFHFSWNFAQSLLGLCGSDSFYGILNLEFVERNRLNGMEYGFESSCICTIIVLLSVLLAVAYRKKLQRGN